MAAIIKSPSPVTLTPKDIKPPAIVPQARPQGGLTTSARPPVMMHGGGPVPADGVYQLKKGEHVLTEAEAKQAKKHALMASGLKSLSKEPPKGQKGAAIVPARASAPGKGDVPPKNPPSSGVKALKVRKPKSPQHLPDDMD